MYEYEDSGRSIGVFVILSILIHMGVILCYPRWSTEIDTGGLLANGGVVQVVRVETNTPPVHKPGEKPAPKPVTKEQKPPAPEQEVKVEIEPVKKEEQRKQPLEKPETKPREKSPEPPRSRQKEHEATDEPPQPAETESSGLAPETPVQPESEVVAPPPAVESDEKPEEKANATDIDQDLESEPAATGADDVEATNLGVITSPKGEETVVTSRETEKVSPAKQGASAPEVETDQQSEPASNQPEPPPPAVQQMFVSGERPVYPKSAMNEEISGTVELCIFVSKNGAIKEVRMAKSSGHDILDMIATRTVEQRWRFKAYTTDYMVPVQLIFSNDFRVHVKFAERIEYTHEG